MKMYRAFNTIGVFSSDQVWFPTYYLLNNLWNFTDASKDLGQVRSVFILYVVF